LSTLNRSFAGRGDRYSFDRQYTLANGWAQVDTYQDAPYFGIWTSPALLQIFTYCEGDLCLEQCNDVADYVDAVKRCIAFYDGHEKPCRIDVFESRFPEMAKAFRDLGLGEFIH